MAKEIVGHVKVAIDITVEDIENIIITAFEGGIDYWAGVRLTAEWYNRPKGQPSSQWAIKMLLEGKSIILYDIEDRSSKYELTLEGLLKGIEHYYVATNYQIDKEDWDAEACDCIVQYAVFGEIIFG